MAAGVVGEGAAYEHGIQELAAGLDFGEGGIVLQGVGIHGGFGIEFAGARRGRCLPNLRAALIHSGATRGRCDPRRWLRRLRPARGLPAPDRDKL